MSSYSIGHNQILYAWVRWPLCIFTYIYNFLCLGSIMLFVCCWVLKVCVIYNLWFIILPSHLLSFLILIGWICLVLIGGWSPLVMEKNTTTTIGPRYGSYIHETINFVISVICLIVLPVSLSSCLSRMTYLVTF